MSKVQFIQPKLRLAEQLKEASGALTIAEALETADDNLTSLMPRAMTELQMAAFDARDCFNGFPTGYSADALQELYGISARAVGIGAICEAPAADTAFISLCALIDHLSERKRWDLEPIAVHVQTLLLLAASMRRSMNEAQIDQILLGLRKVSARYAA